jgi:hypothetical protein
MSCSLNCNIDGDIVHFIDSEKPDPEVSEHPSKKTQSTGWWENLSNPGKLPKDVVETLNWKSVLLDELLI